MQKHRLTVAVVVAILLVAGLGVTAWANAFVWTDRAAAPTCDRQAVFARTIVVAANDRGYYYAGNCETVYASATMVVLPLLVGQTDPQRVVVRNVGTQTVSIAPSQPNESIDPVVSYNAETYPYQLILSDGARMLDLPVNTSVTLTAMPTSLPLAWFIESCAGSVCASLGVTTGGIAYGRENR